MLTGIGRKAQAFWRGNKGRKQQDQEPIDDIQRENLDGEDGEAKVEMSRFGGLMGDIRKNWAEGFGGASIIQQIKPMSLNLLLLYEIKAKASAVTSKRKFREFERWVGDLLETYKDAALEQAARIQLFRLRDEFADGMA
jgi:hypothetical protein